MPVRLTIRPPRTTKPQVVEFDDARVTIGRSSRCDIRLPFRIVSGHHLTITQSANCLQVRDEHSTNGTLLDGEPLAGGVERQLAWGSTLQIVDMSIGVELIPDLGAGFSLEQTGTLARQMLGEALLGSSGEEELDSAYFEVARGPMRGHKHLVPDDLEQGRIADDEDALICIPGLIVELEIYRDGDGFGLRVGRQSDASSPVHLNDSPLLEERRLVSGDTISCAKTELRFVDPIESYLDELDGVVASPEPNKLEVTIDDEPEDTAPLGDGPQETDNPDVSKRSMSALEIGVVAIGLLMLAGVVYLLLSIFGVI